VVLKNITGLKQIEQLKSQFVSMVAHELKTPMAAVLGYLDILIDETMQIPMEKRREYLSRSELRLKSSLELVNDLLDISRMELNTKQREITDVVLIELVQHAIELQELNILNKEIVVDIDIPSDLPVLRIDRDEAIKIINNLISNAVKYNRDKGKIIINSKCINNFIEINIEDTGVGLREKDKERLFEQFFRAKNKYTRSISGTGLGLSIVKRLIEANHGKIVVDSEFEKGTKFTILFPFK
jgi:signal transduction histidine kinase